VLIPKAHFSEAIKSSEHSSRIRCFRLVGKNPSENESNCGQLLIRSRERDGKRVFMLSGNAFKFSKYTILISFRLGAENPPLGNDTNFGHIIIDIEVRLQSSLESCEIISRLLQLRNARVWSFGNKSRGKVLRESQPRMMFKDRRKL
jgi:hypothetical protein